MPAQTVAAFPGFAQRRLAEKEIGVAPHLRELWARRRVAGVRQGRRTVAHAQRERLQLVMRNAHRGDLHAACLEGDSILVCTSLERVAEHTRHTELLLEHLELGITSRRQPE